MSTRVGGKVGIETGILTGRLPITKANYEYVIIPKRDDVDTYTTSLPAEIMSDTYVVNTRAIVRMLKYIYHVEFRWRLYHTPQGSMYKGFIINHRKIELNHDNPAESLREIEPNIEYFPFEEPPIINEDFLISLARSTGAGVGLPKRFHAIAIATHVDDNGNKTPVLLNLAEAFLWMQENPGKLKGVALLRSYKYAILFAEPITKQELMEDVLDRLNLSVQTFKNMYWRATSTFESEEE